MSKIRVILMGTPDFAVPVLRALQSDDAFDVAAVVTQPDREVGRKRKLTQPPLKQAAMLLGLPVLQPEKVGRPESLEELAAWKPDVFVTAAYGQILPQRLLDLAPLGCINVHASLLPRWRGAAPIHHAIMAGDEVTGVTMMKTVKALDAGPVLATEEVRIDVLDNVQTLHDKLSNAGAKLLTEVLPRYAEGRLTPQPQPEDGVTYANRIERKDEWIDWATARVNVHNQIRGLSPWPGSVTLYGGQPLKIWGSRPFEAEGTVLETGAPGTVRQAPGGQIVVQCDDGWVEITSVQTAGKRRVEALDWWRGQHADSLQFTGEQPTR